MNYRGKLYGRIPNGKHFDTGKTTDDYDNLVKALEELVQLKEWKDKHGKDEHYLNAQPTAWNNAKEALKNAKK